MPKGVPKNGKRQPRLGATLPSGPASSQTQALIDHLQEIEERLAISRAKDKARAGLVAYAHKYGLTASDLRDAAKLVGAREVGDAPVFSPNLGKAKRLALGRKIREARVAKGLQAVQLGKLIGAKGTAAVAQWEGGMVPSLPKYRDGLIKHLDLPKDFFAEVASRQRAAPVRRTNGAHP
jgi:hypothetical protein